MQKILQSSSSLEPNSTLDLSQNTLSLSPPIPLLYQAHKKDPERRKDSFLCQLESILEIFFRNVDRTKGLLGLGEEEKEQKGFSLKKKLVEDLEISLKALIQDLYSYWKEVRSLREQTPKKKVVLKIKGHQILVRKKSKCVKCLDLKKELHLLKKCFRKPTQHVFSNLLNATYKLQPTEESGGEGGLSVTSL